MPRTDPIVVPFEAEDNLSSKSDKIKDTIKNIGIVIGSIVTSAKVVMGAMDEITEAVLKKPELFTEEEVRRAENYAKVSEDLSTSLNRLGLEVMPIVSANLQAISDLPGAFEAIKSGGLNEWAADIINGALGIKDSMNDATDAVLEGGKKQISMMEQLAGASEEQTAKIIYNNLIQKLSVDGITTAEQNMAIEAGIALGIFDEKTAETAGNINTLTDEVINGTASVSDLKDMLNSIETQKTIRINVESNIQSALAGSVAGFGRTGRRQHGGEVAGGGAYVIGEAGPEVFTPRTGGKVTGGGDISSLLRQLIQVTKESSDATARKVATAILKGQARQ